MVFVTRRIGAADSPADVMEEAGQGSHCSEKLQQLQLRCQSRGSRGGHPARGQRNLKRENVIIGGRYTLCNILWFMISATPTVMLMPAWLRFWVRERWAVWSVKTQTPTRLLAQTRDRAYFRNCTAWYSLMFSGGDARNPGEATVINDWSLLANWTAYISRFADFLCRHGEINQDIVTLIKV